MPIVKDLTYGGLFPDGMNFSCKKCRKDINEIKDIVIWWKHNAYCEVCGFKWKDFHKTAGDE